MEGSEDYKVKSERLEQENAALQAKYNELLQKMGQTTVQDAPAKPPRTKYSDRVEVKYLVKESAKSFIGKEITVCGWVRTLREQGGGRFVFIELNDGSTIKNFQIIIDETKPGFAAVSKGVGAGTSLLIKGLVVESPAKGQLIEMQGNEVDILGACDSGKYPLAKTKLQLEFLRTIAHLRPRTNTIGAVTRVRNQLAFAIHKYYVEKGFYYINTPLITASDCEGAGEMFGVTTLLNGISSVKDIPTTPEGKPDHSKDFFGRPSFLTVSGQLNGEIYACAMSKIYTFGPTFRAENSHTTRHLAEFWMIEPEMAFYDLQDNMDLAEDFIKSVIKHVLETCPDDMDFFNKYVEKGLLDRLKNVLESPFQRITYTEAVDLLIKTGQKFVAPLAWGLDLQSEHERYLTEVIYKKPVIVTDYPKEFKSFYMRLNDDGKTVAAMDILVPKIGEIIGGSQREERLDVLERRLEEVKLPKENYSWYLDLRRFGSVTHSGFGLGFERLVQFTTGIENIRDVIPFPRYPGHADF
jgi:asparaginyl-tRNA synthetase